MGLVFGAGASLRIPRNRYVRMHHSDPRRPQALQSSSSSRLASLLLLASGPFLGLVIYAQLVAQTSPWPWESPADLSSSALAAAGLAWTLAQALMSWRAGEPCRHWLLGSAGLALIFMAECAVDEVPAFDFRLVILAWMIAAGALLLCTRPYGTESVVRWSMRAALVGQAFAHGVWLLDNSVFGPVAVFHPRMEFLTDTGEMLALLGYLGALLLARFSPLDGHARQHHRQGTPRDPHQTDSLRRMEAPLRVCFTYIAQLHQILHSLPIAAALARRHPGIEVHVAARTGAHLRFAQRLVRRHAADANLRYVRLAEPLSAWIAERLSGHGGKKMVLSANRHYFAGFDAIVTPERTSTYLKKLRIPHLRLVGTEHGAGDREVTFSPETAKYDFLLLPGDKQAQRLQALHRIEPQRIHAGIYAKHDWTIGSRESPLRLFDNDRPTVLYNPHFERALSSWPVLGWQLLEWFARSQRYNLIFAPHLRLFHRPTRFKYAPFRALQRLPHLHVDLGSERSVDMSYTLAADIYLGDVSSQVVEFIMQPRPCVFVNAHRVTWADDPHYRFWRLGPVIENVEQLDAALDEARKGGHASLQRDYLHETLGTAMQGHNAARGADAIVEYLLRCVTEAAESDTPATTPPATTAGPR